MRFPITENTFEIVITNLDADDFPPEELKKLYAMRWGIETSLPIMVLDGKPVIDYDMIERMDAGRNEKIEVEHRIDRSTSSIPQEPTQREEKTFQAYNSATKITQYSEADEIEKFKRLLDKGIITKEEFEAKKKQLLGI